MHTEDEFTGASGWCPEPHLWHAHDSESSEAEVGTFIGALVRTVKPSIAVETGSAYGYTTREIGIALTDNGRGCLWTVEIDRGRADDVAQLCRDLPVTVACDDSLKWTPPEGINLCFFDSLGPLRQKEFLRYRPHMAEGCIVAFHDMAPHHGIKQDVEALMERGMIRAIFLHTPRGLCIGEIL